MASLVIDYFFKLVNYFDFSSSINRKEIILE